MSVLPETAAFGRILDWRSVGVHDLVAGLAEDVPPLPHARYRLVAATVTTSPRHPVGAVVGDLLVRVPSAYGRDRGGAELFPAPTSCTWGGPTTSACSTTRTCTGRCATGCAEPVRNDQSASTRQEIAWSALFVNPPRFQPGSTACTRPLRPGRGRAGILAGVASQSSENRHHAHGPACAGSSVASAHVAPPSVLTSTPSPGRARPGPALERHGPGRTPGSGT